MQHSTLHVSVPYSNSHLGLCTLRPSTPPGDVLAQYRLCSVCNILNLQTFSVSRSHAKLVKDENQTSFIVERKRFVIMRTLPRHRPAEQL